MPVESARGFIQRLESDQGYRRSLSQVIRERDLVQRLLFIESSGFEFTAADLATARRRLGAATSRDLVSELDVILCSLLFLEPPRS